MSDWLTSLQTDTPQQDFELAITLARKGIGTHNHPLRQEKVLEQDIQMMLIV